MLESLVRFLPLFCVPLFACGPDAGLAITVQLGERGGMCDYFVDLGVVDTQVGIQVDVGTTVMSKLDASHWQVEDGRIDFSFAWPDGVADGAIGHVEFGISQNQHIAHGEASFIAHPEEYVSVTIEASCSEETL